MSAMISTFFLSIPITLVALLVVRARRDSPAGERHAVATGAFVALLALPLASLVPLPRLTGVGGVPGLGDRIREAAGVVARGLEAAGTETAESLPGVAERAASGAPLWEWVAVIAAGVWGLGAAVLFIRLALGHRWARRLARGAGAVRVTGRGGGWASVQTRRPFVPVVMHAEAPVPFVQGVLRSTVVVPAAAIHWSARRVRTVLEHELAHARRKDGLWTLIGQIATRLFWPNPFAWCLLRVARLDAERAADAAVVRSGLPPRRYVDELLDLVQESSGARAGLLEPAAAAMSRASELEGRVRALLDPAGGTGEAGFRRVALWTGLALIATIVLSAAARPGPAGVGPWLDVSAEGPAVRVLPGAAIRFEGTGSLVFREGRRRIELGDGGIAQTDGGTRLPVGPWDGGPVILRDGQGEWTLTPIDSIPEGPGSRIRDDGEGDARVDSRDRMTFYLAVDEEGTTTFYHPAD